MGRTEKIKLRRVLNELRFLYGELGFIEDLCSQGATEFDAHYREYCAQNDIDLKKLNKENADKIQQAYGIEQIEEDNTPSDIPHTGSSELSPYVESKEIEFTPSEDAIYKELHAMFNKIFKKLALKLHPDRIENYILDNDQKFKLKNDFSKARNSLEKKKYFRLLEIAEEHGVYATEHYGLQLKWFKKERDNIRKHLTKEKCTYNYLFAQSDSDKERDKLIREFLHQLFGIKV